MKLQILRPSDNVVLVQATFNGQTQTTVLDTATQTGPVPMVQWVADQGGTRPVEVPRGPRLRH